MDTKLIPEICKLQATGGTAALVTIIATNGSTPRKTGSQMLVMRDGRILGTIGGGCGEAAAKNRALMALDDGQSAVYTVNMLNSAASDEGMACGGMMKLFIQLV